MGVDERCFEAVSLSVIPSDFESLNIASSTSAKLMSLGGRRRDELRRRLVSDPNCDRSAAVIGGLGGERGLKEARLDVGVRAPLGVDDNKPLDIIIPEHIA